MEEAIGVILRALLSEDVIVTDVDTTCTPVVTSGIEDSTLVNNVGVDINLVPISVVVILTIDSELTSGVGVDTIPSPVLAINSVLTMGEITGVEVEIILSVEEDMDSDNITAVVVDDTNETSDVSIVVLI